MKWTFFGGLPLYKGHGREEANRTDIQKHGKASRAGTVPFHNQFYIKTENPSYLLWFSSQWELFQGETLLKNNRKIEYLSTPETPGAKRRSTIRCCTLLARFVLKQCKLDCIVGSDNCNLERDLPGKFAACVFTHVLLFADDCVLFVFLR